MMVMSDWSMVQWNTGAEWRSVSVRHGEQLPMISGHIMMGRLSADSLDTLIKVFYYFLGYTTMLPAPCIYHYIAPIYCVDMYMYM